MDKECKEFIGRADAALRTAGISRDELAMLDHVCYRVETDERYKELQREIGRTAVLIDESMVAGRLIATFEFEEPVNAAGWYVPYLELPAPKPGSRYTQGFEHAEFVVIGDAMKFAARHAGLAFTHKPRTLNPELGLVTDGVALKFHEQPLGAVVRIEQRIKEENYAAHP